MTGLDPHVRSPWERRLERWFRNPVAATAKSSSTQVGETHAAAVVDVALRTAALAVQCGALTSQATTYALTIGSAYGLDMEVDVTWTAITISYHRRGSVEPITGFRGVRERLTNYTTLTNLSRLVDAISEGKVGVTTARAALDDIRIQAPSYRRWVIAAAYAMMGVAVAGILGGGVMELVLSAIANVALYLVTIPLYRTSLSIFFIQAVAASVPTAMGMIAMWIRSDISSPLYPVLATVSPSMVVTSGIVSLLAGTGIVATARDALDGNLVTASARTLDVVIQTAGIVAGVVVTMWIGFRIGIEGYIAPTTGWASMSVMTVFWAACLSITCGFGFGAGLRAMPVIAVVGALGWAAYQYSLPLIGNWPGSIFIGAFVAGLFSQIASRWWRYPTIALLTPAIISMVPGSILYRAIFEVVSNMDEAMSVYAQTQFVQATLTGIALAAGSALGAQFGLPLNRPASALQHTALVKVLRASRSRPLENMMEHRKVQ